MKSKQTPSPPPFPNPIPLPTCRHRGPGECQNAYQTGGQPFETIKACVLHFLPYYKTCVGYDKEDAKKRVCGHVMTAYQRGEIIDTAGDDPLSVTDIVYAASG